MDPRRGCDARRNCDPYVRASQSLLHTFNYLQIASANFMNLRKSSTSPVNVVRRSLCFLMDIPDTVHITLLVMSECKARVRQTNSHVQDRCTSHVITVVFVHTMDCNVYRHRSLLLKRSHLMAIRRMSDIIAKDVRRQIVWFAQKGSNSHLSLQARCSNWLRLECCES